MEALGDAVVFGEAPHAHDLLGPFGQGPAEGAGVLEVALAQRCDQLQERAGVPKAGPLALVLEAQEGAELLLELVDAEECRMLGEELAQALLLVWIHPVAAHAQDTQPGPVPAEGRAE